VEGILVVEEDNRRGSEDVAMSVERRLAATLSTDVKDYSRSMGVHIGNPG
jgi:hypothetical protein